MLTAHGDDEYAAGTVYEIGDESDFPGAYGVEKDGTSVTITHAPSPAGVLELRPDADLALPDADDGTDDDGTDGGDGNTTDGDGTDDDENTTDEGGDGSDGSDGSDGGDGGSTEGSTPGFGVPAALVALVAALALVARRTV